LTTILSQNIIPQFDDNENKDENVVTHIKKVRQTT
jgi:hypothetical protein